MIVRDNYATGFARKRLMGCHEFMLSIAITRLFSQASRDRETIVLPPAKPGDFSMILHSSRPSEQGSAR
ncbi:MAG: hypothetical protein EOP13_14975 [Pseudomonas sp.]|uniref:hypothetical protein n=1 Tax=Pseudomonas sp. TaxID=306 RepID=UPI0011F8E464|nr:hypothetical protein [Pseudomonas sp.]RZI72472.1 MAG: hypothetical protein EOP13_14975 [Pseudomonas sp.]